VVLIRGVADHQIGDHAQIPMMGRLGEPLEIRQAADAGINAEKIRHVVAVIPQGRLKDRHQPQTAHPQVLDVVELLDQPAQIAVAIAKENAEKPAVVRAELGVASSYLPAPSESDLAFARQRAAKADQKDYKVAEEYGKKLLAKINTDWSKMEKDQAEAKRVSDLKDAKIKELTAEIARVKKEASANIWSLTGAGLVVMGGLACAFASIRIGIPILMTGAFAAAFASMAMSDTSAPDTPAPFEG
jgi:hypothetical protein